MLTWTHITVLEITRKLQFNNVLLYKDTRNTYKGSKLLQNRSSENTK